MSVDRTNRGPADRSLINVNEDYELRYWSGKFGCTHDELKAAVKKVGVMAVDLKAYLKKTK